MIHVGSQRLERYLLEHGLHAVARVCAALCGRRSAVAATSRVRLSQPPQRVLVIQLFALGDLMLSLPAFRALRSTWPEADLTLVMLGGPLPALVQRSNIFDDIRPLDGGLRGGLRLLRQLRSQRWDIAVVLNPILLGGWLARAAGAVVRAGWMHDRGGRQAWSDVGGWLFNLPIEPADADMHDADRYLQLVAVLCGRTTTDTSPELSLTDSDRARARSILQSHNVDPSRIIAVHPGAKWPHRRWAEDRVAAVCDYAAARLHATPVLLGAAADAERIRRVQSHMHSSSVSLVGETDLIELAAIVELSRLFIGHDSGPMHIAAAVRVPVIGIFGPGDWVKFAPYRTPHRVVRHPVWCSPCRIQFIMDCPNNICMKRLAVGEVTAAIDDLVAELGLAETSP